jgi:hypothetical protein
MVDTMDLKSIALTGVWVRLPPSVPGLSSLQLADKWGNHL